MREAIEVTQTSRPEDETNAKEGPNRKEGPVDEGLDQILADEDLASYWPTERLAIFEFRLAAGTKLQRVITVKEAVNLWEDGACTRWRREKMHLDGQRQLEEIERHKFLVSQGAGYDVGWEKAAKDWIERHAASWRMWWENQPDAHPKVP